MITSSLTTSMESLPDFAGSLLSMRWPMNRVFVYGSLRKGFGNHRLLEESTYIGEATTYPSYTMLHLGGFPGLVAEGSTPIKGEVYEVDDYTLARLDRLESHPDFYERTPIELADGMEAEVYLLPTDWLKDNQKIVSSGDWADRGNR
jgi:gamma-glutamylaminecyclotransferase